MHIVIRHAKRIGVALVGGIVVVVGIIAIPYPGPGVLITFAGLAILATEFAWAQRLLDHAKERYEALRLWMAAQPAGRQLTLNLAFSCLLLLIIWLVNGYGILADWLHIDWPWLHSPLIR